jgi:hypothetical protein
MFPRAASFPSSCNSAIFAETAACVSLQKLPPVRQYHPGYIVRVPVGIRADKDPAQRMPDYDIGPGNVCQVVQALQSGGNN